MWQGNIKAAKLKQSEQVELLAFLANLFKKRLFLDQELAALAPALAPAEKAAGPVG